MHLKIKSLMYPQSSHPINKAKYILHLGLSEAYIMGIDKTPVQKPFKQAKKSCHQT